MLVSSAYSQNEEKPQKRKGNFEKSAFSKSNSRTDSNIPDKQLGPPNPGGGGWPTPATGGIGFLIVGSLIFWSNKAYKELKNE